MRAAAFTHDTAGTTEAAWLAAPWWDGLPILGLPPTTTALVVLVAHPDDETLGIAGLLHAAARQGNPVTVVFATDGEASHPGSPTHPPKRLAGIRRAEAAAAVAVLAPAARVVFLGLPDGGLVDQPDALVAGLQAVAPDEAWVLTTWAGDRHPDHAACAAAGRQVCAGRNGLRQWEFPVWAWHWDDPADPELPIAALRRFPVDAAGRAARQTALTAYPSQTRPLGPADADAPVLPPEVLAHFARDRDVLLDPVRRPAGDPAFFADLFADDVDPWHLETSWYERRKRALILAALPRERFRTAFEPGCARGDLSALLVGRCDRLLCADVAPAAVATTRARLGDRADVVQGAIPGTWPELPLDLVVLSEIAYYVEDLAALAARIDASLTADGVLVLAHWRRAAADHPHTAEVVHATLRERTGLHVLAAHLETDFRLDVLARDPRAVSEAAAAGVAP